MTTVATVAIPINVSPPAQDVVMTTTRELPHSIRTVGIEVRARTVEMVVINVDVALAVAKMVIIDLGVAVSLVVVDFSMAVTLVVTLLVGVGIAVVIVLGKLVICLEKILIFLACMHSLRESFVSVG